MTLSLHLETWFKVTARPLSKGILWLKYEPDRAKARGEKICSGQEISDRRTYHYRASAEQGFYNLFGLSVLQFLNIDCPPMFFLEF